MLNNWQERTNLLLGKKHQYLKDANVLIVGLGGVGGIAAEMLCRAGVGKMTIVDGDDIDVTNLNRQIFTNQKNIGESKAKIIAKKLLEINPEIKLNIIDNFITEDKMIDLFVYDFDYVVDAIDTLAPKVALIYHSMQKGMKIVSSMGSGGKLNPSLVQVADIGDSHSCTLARMVRKNLHKHGIRTGFKVIFSSEKRIEESMIYIDAQNKRTNLGTISYMPAIFGSYAAWVVVDDLTRLAVE